MTNQIKNSILVQLDINRIKKILNDRKSDNAVLDDVENKINKLCSNSSDAFPLENEPKLEQPKLIKDKHGKKKFKTLYSTRFPNLNKDITDKIQGSLAPKFKISVKNGNGRKLHGETHLSKFNMETIKNMIPLPEIKVYAEDASSNEGKKYPYFRFVGFVDVMSSSDDDDIKIKQFIPITNETSEIVQQQALVTEKSEPLLESIKSNNTNTTSSMDEFNICKESIQTNLSEKMLSDASSSSIIDLVGVTLNSNSDNESPSVPRIIVNEKFNHTEDEKYKILKIIVFNNYNIYHEKIMINLATTLKKNQLLWNLNDAWNTLKANPVKIILEDILKLISSMENKNIIFMGCLSIIFRNTVISHYNITDTDLYGHFTLFVNVIEKCLMNINDDFWKTMLPNGWNIFCNGCLIVDLVIHGKKMSMGKYVNWNEFPSIQRCHNNLKSQLHLNEHNSPGNKSKKPLSDLSLIPNILDIPNIRNSITANDGEPVLKKRSIDISSMPSISNESTKPLPQNNYEKLAKKKKVDNTSLMSINND